MDRLREWRAVKVAQDSVKMEGWYIALLYQAKIS